MKRSCVAGLTAFAAALSCAQPPTKELDLAAARVEIARRVDAPVFAAAIFEEAEASLAEARRLAESTREYRAALQAAAHASIRADEAFFLASGERMVVVRKLDRILFELESLIEMAAVRGAAEKAPTELAAFRASYAAVGGMVEDRDLLGALAAGQALKPALLDFEERFSKTNERPETSPSPDPSR